MLLNKACDIVDLCVEDDPAVIFRSVLSQLIMRDERLR